jgi:hypothetical protein
MSWTPEFRQAVVTQLFLENNGAGLHDAIYDATEKSLDGPQLRAFVSNLPEELLCTALQWTMSDTQFREDVCRCLERNKIDITGAATYGR